MATEYKQIRVRRDTLANLQAQNPTLADGEPVWVTDTRDLVAGPGAFNDLWTAAQSIPNRAKASADSAKGSADAAAASATGAASAALSITGPVVPSSFRRWRLALAAVRAGVRDAKVLCVGDSTTAGTGAAGPNVGSTGSYPYQLASVLNAYVPSARGLAIPPSISAGNPDPRWTVGSGWSVLSLGWGNANDYTAPANTTNALVFTGGVAADRFDIYYATNSGLGSFTAQASGGTAVVTSASAAGGVGKVTISAGALATTNTVSITNPSSGAVHILGIEPWQSTTRVVRVGNAGSGSTKSSDWVLSASTFGGPSCIKAYAPDLTIISLGINDAATPATANTVSANVQLLAQAAAVSGDVLILPPFPSTPNGTANQLQYEPLYAAAVKALGFPYLDTYERFGQPGSTVTDSIGMMNDAVHPNAFGYSDLAQMIGTRLGRV